MRPDGLVTVDFWPLVGPAALSLQTYLTLGRVPVYFCVWDTALTGFFHRRFDNTGEDAAVPPGEKVGATVVRLHGR